jgi:hypothetical protein
MGGVLTADITGRPTEHGGRMTDDSLMDGGKIMGTALLGGKMEMCWYCIAHKQDPCGNLLPSLYSQVSKVYLTH